MKTKTTKTTKPAIRFLKHFVTDGSVKAKVHYSHGQIYVDTKIGASAGFKECITLYAKSYSDGPNLRKIFPAAYQNDTDIMTDYFEEGRVRIFPENELFAAALLLCN
ncbi:MAG: hypothetical protein WC679_00830 [Bacteroidales bacterium]|jgi:hypothetical protein